MVLTLGAIAGLPAHPLVVHAAVVLVPLAAIAHLVTGWRPAWRRSFAIPVALIGFAGAVFAWAARASGEALEDRVKDAARAVGQRARFGDHPEQGDAAFFWAMLLGLALIGFAVLAWLERKRELPRWAPLAAWGAVVVIAAVATATMTVAGHSGAQLVWKDVGNFVRGG
ncbi:DUF2231 domain-containing protein [Tepidiforma thermophila]|uniref:DUF2231 domain-containing protein n=1 Tax=Tepidiforma thermophila (strain KCTC 52669 / CGMCC 1.13589 / G233) TaxID=2761530 RepID=A0A2A9HDZ8_TEPT2|nr:DUF2231 domain-containing protein [Tepidiforma thermophila]PFG73361.1 hypothetical protein A9A59_0556 [Tepidiforma thermophila]